MWYDPIENPPPENTDVLVYTDTDKMKVARLYHGKWDTYMKVIYWMELPNPPKIANMEEVSQKKRGRPKKDEK